MLPADIPPLPPLPASMVLAMPELPTPRSSTHASKYGAIAERVSLRTRRDGNAAQELQPPPLPPALMNDDDSRPTRDRSFSTWIEQCVPHPESRHNANDVWAELDDIAGYNTRVAAELQRAIDMPHRIASEPSSAASGTGFLSTFKQKARRALADGLSAAHAQLRVLASALRDALLKLFS